MSKELIISREYEKQQLQDCYDTKESQLVLVYGRRRVGKSFLVNQFFVSVNFHVLHRTKNLVQHFPRVEIYEIKF